MLVTWGWDTSRCKGVSLHSDVSSSGGGMVAWGHWCLCMEPLVSVHTFVLAAVAVGGGVLAGTEMEVSICVFTLAAMAVHGGAGATGLLVSIFTGSGGAAGWGGVGQGTLMLAAATWWGAHEDLNWQGSGVIFCLCSWCTTKMIWGLAVGVCQQNSLGEAAVGERCQCAGTHLCGPLCWSSFMVRHGLPAQKV